LLVGIAGASSGIEIARRFGIPDNVVQAAFENVSADTRDATEYLRRIKREADEAEVLRIALEEERAAVAEKYASLDGDAARQERKRQAIFENELLLAIEEFETRSRDAIAKVEDRTERLKAERDAQKQATELKRQAKQAARVATAVRSSTSSSTRGVRVVRDGRVVDQKSQSSIESEDDFRPAAPRPIKKGDSVRLKSFGSIGIVDAVTGEEAEVRVKSLRFREKLSNLELVEVKRKPDEDTIRDSRFRSLAQNRSTEVHLRAHADDTRTELNVIGRTTDEAVDETDKFLDHAFLNGLEHVRIIHGHGTGALRRAIGNLLKDHPHVARVSQAPQDQGGSGATLVELKQ
jgi:DNA mismatch repair protein MutS2